MDAITHTHLDNISMLTTPPLDAAKIKQTGDAMYRILDRIGLQYVVNGATNHLVAGLIFAKPVADNLNEILTVACSGEAGVMDVFYATTDKRNVEIYQLSPLIMQGSDLSISTAQQISIATP